MDETTMKKAFHFPLSGQPLPSQPGAARCAKIESGSAQLPSRQRQMENDTMGPRMGSAVVARVDKKTTTVFLSTLFCAASLLIGNPAFAQVSGTNISPQSSPLGTMSPLGVGPETPVAPTGIALGSTEL